MTLSGRCWPVGRRGGENQRQVRCFRSRVDGREMGEGRVQSNLALGEANGRFPGRFLVFNRPAGELLASVVGNKAAVVA